jgi:biopolymer transport protein ExbD
MNFRSGGFRPQKERVGLDLTPLIDIIFQLLIFFLLTASFITTPNLGVELPKASSKAATSQQQDVRISISRDGKVELENKTVAIDSLLRRLKALQKERPKARVLIHADKKAYHGDVVKVMDAAKAAKFRRLGVAIQSR